MRYEKESGALQDSKNWVESTEESEDSIVLEQIFKERFHNTSAHYAYSAGAIFWKHRNHALDFRFFGDETPFFKERGSAQFQGR